MAENDAIQRVVDALQSGGSYKRLASAPFRERGSTFDTILRGADPMSIVVIEYKDRPDAQFWGDILKELRTFVWSLFNEGKRHMVSLVLVFGGAVLRDQVAELARNLSGTCRVYAVSQSMTAAALRAELVSLVSPEFFSLHTAESSADKLILEILAVKTKAKQEFAHHLVELVKDSGTVEDVTRKLLKSYKERVREVENATPSPQS
jgi:hypothetical protein